MSFSPKVRPGRTGCRGAPLLKRSEGYKQYDTGRKHMARMGDWRNDKDEEIALDGIGGVNILVKADVHRSGRNAPRRPPTCADVPS